MLRHQTHLRHLLWLLILSFVLGVAVVRAEEPDHEIHEALRALLQSAAEAINRGDYDGVQPLLAEAPRITPITQEFSGSRAALAQYFRSYFGEGGKLRALQMRFEPDALTELSPDKSWGLAYGKGMEVYTLSDGRVFPMPTRWTSVVVREADGQWRIRSMHIGTNFLDNPLLDEVEQRARRYLVKVGLLGAAGGLFAGWLLGRLRRR